MNIFVDLDDPATRLTIQGDDYLVEGVPTAAKARELLIQRERRERAREHAEKQRREKARREREKRNKSLPVPLIHPVLKLKSGLSQKTALVMHLVEV